jgi:hypothetical protein
MQARVSRIIVPLADRVIVAGRAPGNLRIVAIAEDGQSIRNPNAPNSVGQFRHTVWPIRLILFGSKEQIYRPNW